LPKRGEWNMRFVKECEKGGFYIGLNRKPL
jgi:hypothetical protein